MGGSANHEFNMHRHHLLTMSIQLVSSLKLPKCFLHTTIACTCTVYLQQIKVMKSDVSDMRALLKYVIHGRAGNSGTDVRLPLTLYRIRAEGEPP